MKPSEFHREFNCERKAVDYFKKEIESNLSSCKSCQSNKLNWNERLKGWKCCKCSKLHSLKSLTFMRDSNLPFLPWLEVIYYLTRSKKTPSVLEISSLVGISRYKTVLFMVNRIRKEMGEVNLKFTYTKRSVVKMNEVYSKEKDVYFTVFYGQQHKKGKDFIRLEIPKMYLSDYHRSCEVLRAKEKYRHKKALLTVFKGYKRWEKEKLREMNNLSLKQTWEWKIKVNFLKELRGIFHQVSKPYFQHVLDEYCFKYNFREAPEDKFKIFIRWSFTPR